MKLRLNFLILTAAILTGCANTYTYDGTQYTDEQAFRAGVDGKLAAAVTAIQPNTAPISNKTLIFAIPSEHAIYQQSLANIRRTTGREASAAEQKLVLNLSSANFRSIRSFYEIIVRKNIYSNVKYQERNTATGDLIAASNQDVLYWSEPQLGSGQWYYTTAKSGKQVFAFDKGAPTMAERSIAFADAVQVFAIRE